MSRISELYNGIKASFSELFKAVFAKANLDTLSGKESGRYHAIIEYTYIDTGEVSNKTIHADTDIDTWSADMSHRANLKMPHYTECGSEPKEKNRRQYCAIVISTKINKRNLDTCLRVFNESTVLPTYVAQYRDRAYLYFVLETPIMMFKDNIDIIKNASKNMAKKLSYILNNQYLTVGKSEYGAVPIYTGSIYKVGDYVSFDMLNKTILRDCPIEYKPPTVTLEKAKLLYPQFYRDRIEQGKPKSSTGPYFNFSPKMYECYLRRCDEVESSFTLGYAKTIVIMGVKCAIEKDKVEKDVAEFLNSRDTCYDSSLYNAKSIVDDYYLPRNHYCTKETISRLSGLFIEGQKRNGLTQKEHLAAIHQKRRENFAKDPSLVGSYAGLIEKWRKEHQSGTVKECVFSLGIKKSTVYKWWNGEEMTKRLKNIAT